MAGFELSSEVETMTVAERKARAKKAGEASGAARKAKAAKAKR